MLFVAGCALLLVTTLVSVFRLALLKGTLLAFVEVEGPALLPGHHLSARVNILAKNGTIKEKNKHFEQRMLAIYVPTET